MMIMLINGPTTSGFLSVILLQVRQIFIESDEVDPISSSRGPDAPLLH